MRAARNSHHRHVRIENVLAMTSIGNPVVDDQRGNDIVRR
jgi:hypothetical protein